MCRLYAPKRPPQRSIQQQYFPGKEKLVALIEKHKCDKQAIADELGFHIQTVHRYVRQYQLTHLFPTRAEKRKVVLDKEAIQKALEQKGFRLHQTCEKLQVSYATFVHEVERLGLTSLITSQLAKKGKLPRICLYDAILALKFYADPKTRKGFLMAAKLNPDGAAKLDAALAKNALNILGVDEA
jgi:hypothetical protein